MCGPSHRLARTENPPYGVWCLEDGPNQGDEYEECRRLLALRGFLESELASVNAALALAALALTEGGRTRREIAAVLGVGSSTVHGWVMHARRLKGM